MRRLYLLLAISVCCAVAGRAGAQQIGVSETHDGGVFGVHVGEIVSWLALKQDVQMSGGLAHWDNNVSGAGGAGESVAVLRLVLNRDVRVLGVATPLRHPSITRSSLATRISITSRTPPLSPCEPAPRSLALPLTATSSEHRAYQTNRSRR